MKQFIGLMTIFLFLSVQLFAQPPMSDLEKEKLKAEKKLEREKAKLERQKIKEKEADFKMVSGNNQNDNVKQNDKAKQREELKALADRARAEAAAKLAAEENRVKAASEKAKELKEEEAVAVDKEIYRRTRQCNYLYDETDAMTGKTKIAVQPEFFFGHTQEELKKFMEGDDYLTCKAYVSSVTGISTLNVVLRLDSPYAKEEYGSIQVGSQMILRLIDGETITLLSEKYDSGSVNKTTGKTTYRTLFIIPPKAEKILAKVELDKIRMVWGTGYEDYEIFKVDFLIDQFKCLLEAQN